MPTDSLNGVEKTFYYIHKDHLFQSLGRENKLHKMDMGVICDANNKARAPPLHVDDSGQLLDSVEQQVPLLDGLLVLPVLTVRPVDE